LAALDIAPEERQTVVAILGRLLPGREVRAFGSRVASTARKTSDLDLALITERPIPPLLMADLKEAFTESDLPFRVDLVDWSRIGDRFRRIIDDRYIVLQEAGSPTQSSSPK